MLTQKQELFCRYIVEGLSQREAYRKAYPNSKAKDKTVDEMASRMLKEHKVSTRIEELRREIKEQITREAVADKKELLESLTSIVRSSPLDVVEFYEDKKGSPHIRLKEGVDGSTIQSLAVDRYGNIQVKMHSKSQAINRLLDELEKLDGTNTNKTVNVVFEKGLGDLFD